jgi:hypothetical protein
MRGQRLGETPSSVISLKLTMPLQGVETGRRRAAIITFDDTPTPPLHLRCAARNGRSRDQFPSGRLRLAFAWKFHPRVPSTGRRSVHCLRPGIVSFDDMTG